MGENINLEWDFSDEEKSFAEIYFSSETDSDTDGFVIKEILRTGEWSSRPTSAGLLKKPLKIVKDGKSNSKEGVISLSEIVENFKLGAIPNVQIPLSDDENEHKNTTRLNTGYVRDIWIVDNDEGSKLVAKMEFTEPDIKEKVLRGTYSDVSCGIPFAINSQDKSYGPCLEHVAITNKPFVDGLGPFIAASNSDNSEVEIIHFSLEENETKSSEVSEESDNDSNDQQQLFDSNKFIQMGNSALVNSFPSNTTFTIGNVQFNPSNSSGFYLVTDTTSKTSWTVPYEVTTTPHVSVQLSPKVEWIVTDEGEEDAPVVEATAPRQPSDRDGLEAAQSLREIRLSEPAITTKEAKNMPTMTREELDRLDLSDEQRAAFQTILEENVELSAKAREASADERISELEEMGFKEKPGFLKFYREVMLSDDSGPAVVLLSDSEQKESMTALEILDRAIESLSTDGKIILSDQALVSGNDDPPPADASEEVSLEDRVAGVKEALGLK